MIATKQNPLKIKQGFYTHPHAGRFEVLSFSLKANTVTCHGEPVGNIFGMSLDTFLAECKEPSE